MVELQSCASLVNASALCAIEEEVKGEGVNVIAEITAELERERRKNAELLERISILEAQIQERNKESLPTNGQGNCPNAVERSFKKSKRQKIELASDGIENGNISKTETASQKTHDHQFLPPKDPNLGDRLVNWMSMDETQFLHFEKFKDGDSTADCDDTDESDDEDDDYREEDDTNSDHKVRDIDENSRIANELKEYLHDGVDEGSHIPCLQNSSGGQSEPTYTILNHETNKYQKENHIVPDKQPVYDERELKRVERNEPKKTGGHKAPSEILTFDKDVAIQDLEAYHCIKNLPRFSHFSILRKGEPYVSPKNPGEHVLYENPGVRRKVFYPNRQNPTLCPVQILEEEKAMRPSDASCPSCLFLCIKYVRQRMGRNKLKSFGPLMCRKAMLVHIRSGSFFFKALGITLLFMAGFPDDLVQRETKYRNLDLLQKYYRTDEDAEGEELFLPHPAPCNTQASGGSQQSSGKTVSAKARGRKKANSNGKSNNLQRSSSVQQSTPSSSAPPTQFGLMGCTSIHNQPMAAVQPMPSQTSADTLEISNPAPYHVFPQQQANAFLPIMFWPPPNPFPPGPYPSTYGFPSTANYISIHQQPYYNNPSSSPFTPNKVAGTQKNNVALVEADSDSDSSSSSIDPKEH
ncbi:hypothetical protein SLA2020_404480 [Shorea laevis]